MLSLSPTDRLFVLTGAGVSAESGIPTFRGSDGLWQGHRIEEDCVRGPFADHAVYSTLEQIPRCPCGGRIRPHICWFGEVPFHLEDISAQLRGCTVFLCVGSSGVVYPAAGFVSVVRARPGVRAYYVGPEDPANRGSFDQCFSGKAGAVLPGLFSVET